MKIMSVYDKEFRRYGKVVEGIDTSKLIKVLATKPCPKDGTVYVASDAELEATEGAEAFCSNYYGGLPIQIGYCNGNNHKLNGLEYHRVSEVNIAEKDMILLLGDERDVTDEFTYDTGLVEAFRVPAGVAVEMYGTTLHYAPCNANPDGFRCIVVLPRGTNGPVPVRSAAIPEDKLLMAENKWLIAHKDGGQDPNAFIGLIGENIEV